MRGNHKNRPIHDWLTKINIAWVPGSGTPLIESLTGQIMDCFRQDGHTILAHPGDPPGADVILSTASFGQPVHFRDSLTLTARRKYALRQAPIVFTLLHARPAEWQSLITHLEKALAKETADPADFAFPGMANLAYHTLFEQGKRGGPVMAIARIIQSQAMSVRNIVVIGEEDLPLYAYTFDLVGAHPRTIAQNGAVNGGDEFLKDLMYRILTAASTHEITQHTVEERPIPNEVWRKLETPYHMAAAGRLLGKLGFFTEMVKVANLVDVPLLDHAIASQYSEGCYATWEPAIAGLVSTITGSARPVDKDLLSDDELAVISGIRANGQGACIRQVNGKRNDPPSSEAVEMIAMDQVLPHIEFQGHNVPVARSKLHGHRGVRAYDPRFVEHVYLEPAFYTYPVSCSTEAQANAIRTAFGRSQALQNPTDPRKIVFTILPGHGVLLVEKWVEGKVPFEILCEAMQNGQLEIENAVPQGPFTYQDDRSENNAPRHVLVPGSMDSAMVIRSPNLWQKQSGKSH